MNALAFMLILNGFAVGASLRLGPSNSEIRREKKVGESHESFIFNGFPLFLPLIAKSLACSNCNSLPVSSFSVVEKKKES